MLCPPESPFLPPPPASAPSERLFCRCPPRKPPLFAPHSPAYPVFFPPPGVAFCPAFPGKTAPPPGFSAPVSRQNTRFAPRLPPFCPGLPGGSPPRCGFCPGSRLSGRPRWLSAPALFAPVAAHGVPGKPPPESTAFFAPAVAPPRGPRIPGSNLEKTAAPSRVKFREIRGPGA